MDYGGISFEQIWYPDPDVAQKKRFHATIHAAIFGFTSVCLLISICRTICTNPGNIPDHKEWDMSTDQSQSDDGSDQTAANTPNQSERFTNNIIDKNLKDPREVVHEDFKYLHTSAGPLIANNNRN